jgi:hypothetical protein
MTKQLMLAEVLFDHPDSVTRATTELHELGFEVEVFDLHDPCGEPYVWTEVIGASELDESKFFDWIFRITAPLGGDVLEAGLASKGPCAARRAVEEERQKRETSLCP